MSTRIAPYRRVWLPVALISMLGACGDIVRPTLVGLDTQVIPSFSHGTNSASGPLCSGDIDPEFAIAGLECDDPYPWEPGLFTAWAFEHCYDPSAYYRDVDQDGVYDGCEFLLAKYFAPKLVVDDANEGSCWDAGLDRIGGEYFFGVQLREDTLVRVVYLPSYYADCGSPVHGCFLEPLCDPHRGDSEAIALDLRYDPSTQHWLVERAFLSAHCFEPWPFDAKCAFYDQSELFWAGHVQGAPRIYISLWKHANYKSRASCDGGAASADTCDNNNFEMYFPVVSERQNIGSRVVPFFGETTCPTGTYVGWGSAMVDPSVAECGYFQTVDFTGWQTSGSGSAGSYNWLLGVKLGF